MCGYDTDFGQMEILNLITSDDYLDKKIGYLGLTQLFCENSEVLMLATNRIRIDL
jgi:AP-1 complex subunit gamma-1